MQSSVALLSAVGAAALLTLGCGESQGGSRTMIQNKGSDTLVNVAQAWAENYKNVKPNVAVAVSGGGSGTGISALIDGRVDLANSSREMKPKEIEAAKKNGVEPLKHIVGHDAIAIYVHNDNPIESITLEQLAEIFGEGGKTVKWSDINITVPGAAGNEIVRASRQNNSGTYAYFKQAVLGKKRNYKLGSRDMHGSKDVVDLVAKTPGAIGYSGLAYANDHVKTVPVVRKAGDAPVMPTPTTAIDGSYPIARPLIIYTAGQPTGEVKEYLDWILSDEGQQIIVNKGYAAVRKLD